MLSVVRYVREYRLGEFIKERLRRVRDALLAFRCLAPESSDLFLHRQHDAPKGLDVGGAMPRKLDDDGGDKHLKDDAARQELFGVNLAHLPGSRFLREVPVVVDVGDVFDAFRLQMDDLSTAEKQKQVTAALERFTGLSLTPTADGRWLRADGGGDGKALGFWETAALAWRGSRKS